MNSNQIILSLALAFSVSLVAQDNSPRPLMLPNQCGALALYQVARQLQPGNAELVELLEIQPPSRGFSLNELVGLSQRFGLGLTAVHLRADEELPIPSVAHWNGNHFVALLGRQGRRYEVFDPATHESEWLEASRIRQSASGFFLVQGSPSRPVGNAMAALLSGGALPLNAGWDNDDEFCPDDLFKNEEKCPTCPDEECPPGANKPDDGDCETCDGNGSAVWMVSEPFVNLWIFDKPLFYTTSHDDLVTFKLVYRQRNLNDPDTLVGTQKIFGVGKGWGCNWRWFAQPHITSSENIWLYVPGGGRKLLDYDEVEFMSFLKVVLTGNLPTLYGGISPVARLPLGTSFAISQSWTPQFPSERVDIYGRTNRFVYDTNNNMIRLTQLIDSDGLINAISYQNTNFPHYITKVENPYGRTATLSYDTNGFLTNITDMIGLTNSFQYDSLGLITNMTTDYGTTSFQAITNENLGVSDHAVNRALQVTEPNGGKHLYAWRRYSYQLNPTNSTSLIPDSYPTPNTDPFSNALETSAIHERNSFHWGRQQHAALSAAFRTNAFTTDNLNNLTTNDYNLARMKHWLYATNGSSVSRVLSLLRYPSPDGVADGQRLWYDYAGKSNPDRVGTNSRPSLIARTLPEDTTQLVWFERANEYAKPTKIATTYSTVGTNVYLRTNTLTYANNNINLREVRGQGNELLAAFDGYYDVRPSLFTNWADASTFYVTALTINTNNRQVTSIKWPSGLTTTNIYYTTGHTNWLQETKDLETTNNYTFTYTNGLVRTFTDARGLTVTLGWDELERLTSASFPNGDVNLAYNKLDLASVTDRLNNTHSFTYNSVRQLTQTVDPLNRTNVFDRCDCGSLEAVIDPLNRTTSFSYDALGRRTNIVYPGGYSITNFYSQIGRLTNVTDNVGSSTANWYSNQGLLIASSNAFGQVFKGIYDHKNRPTNSVTADGVVIDQTFDDLNRLLTRKWPDNGVERFFYTARGLTNYTDQLTNITHFYHNEAGWLTKRIHLTPGGSPVETNRFEYHQSGDLLRLYDGNDQLTSWAYDQYGRVTGKTNAAGITDFVYQYDTNDRLTSRTTSAKGTTSYAYDKVGNLTNINYAVSPDITNYFDALNRLTNMVDATGTTRFAYNVNGLLDSEDGPWSDDTISYGYNTGRLRTSLTLQEPNASSWVQSYLYDSVRRLTNVASPAGSFGYEFAPGVGSATTASTLIKKLSLPGGSYATNDFDSVARLLGTKLKNSAHIVLNSHDYLYNVGGERTKQTFKDLNYLDHTYDTLGQLKTALGKESGGSISRLHEQFKYGYDYAQNLNYRTNNALIQTFNNNNLNQLTTVTRNTTNALTVAGTTTTNATSVTVNSLTADRYTDATFAKAGFSLTDGNNTFTAIGSDPLGRSDTNAVTVNLPATVSCTYDSNGNLTSDGRRTFVYDDENQLTRVTVTNAGGLTLSEFVYDGLFRRRVRKEYSNIREFVTGATLGTPGNYHSGWVGFRLVLGPEPMAVTSLGRWVVSGNSQAHTVKIVQADGTDLAGASVSVSTSGATTNQLKYVDLGIAVTLAANTAYYIVSQEVSGGDYWYDSDTVVSTTAAASVTGQAWANNGTTSYNPSANPNHSYGPVGFKYAGGSESLEETRYVYDGRLVVQERDGDNLPVVSYTRGPDLSGTREGAGGTSGLLARTDHGRLAIGNAQAHAFYHADGNGNVTALINDKQVVGARYSYDPFGNILSKSGPLADGNTYRFSSQEYHQPSGSVLYLYRAYDPNLQRFINRDPIQELGGINLYGFVFNDPINTVDLWGLEDPGMFAIADTHEGRCEVARGVGQALNDFRDLLRGLLGDDYGTAPDGTPNVGGTPPGGKALEKAVAAIGKKAGDLWCKYKAWREARRAARAAHRALDDILKNDDLFKRWLKSSHNPNMPLSPSDAKNVWDKLQKMGKRPRLDPGHPGTQWPGPHINVDGTHIPVDPGFTP